MGYRFSDGVVESKNKIILYGLVAVVFILSAFLITFTNQNQSSSSGYIIANKEKTGVQTAPSTATTTTQIDDVQKQLDRLKSDITSFSSNLTSCYTGVADMTSKLQSCNTDFALCRTDVAKLSANRSATEQLCENEQTNLQLQISTLKSASNALNSSLSTASKDLDSLKTKYTNLANNAANNLCCKARVDNPKIKFYEIVSDKIVCTEDSGAAVSC